MNIYIIYLYFMWLHAVGMSISFYIVGHAQPSLTLNGPDQ